jgi:hypothetical protein
LGREGRWAGGLLQMRAEKMKKSGKELGRGRKGKERGFDLFFLFFFFKSIFKPISNLFKFKSFTCFQIQTFTPILQTFSQLFLRTFSQKFF